MADFLLGGLSADNLLAYLAALGTLRTATLAMPEQNLRMSWENSDGAWRAHLHCADAMDRHELIERLHTQLQGGETLAALQLADDLTISLSDFRNALLDSQGASCATDRRNADFLAAFGSEAVESRLNGKPTGQITDTAFRTMSGAGHQHFLGTIRTLIADTTKEHIDKSLFNTWAYDDPLEKHSLRWDPMDDIRYALRWGNPSGDRNRKMSGSMWGANRLAVEALPLFPTQPDGSKLKTTGFAERPNRTIELSWPIWSSTIGLQELRSLLALPDLQAPSPDHARLAAMGITDMFRCLRITQGKYRNFTPAQPV